MKLRALVVEDEWATRNDLARMLQSSGGADVVGAVASADAARQALDVALVDGAVDVAFVDVELVGSPHDHEGSISSAATRAAPAPPHSYSPPRSAITPSRRSTSRSWTTF
jgi:DNA-binding LytR/AlgR family response regulator